MHTTGPWFAHGKLRRVILTQLDPRHSRQVAELSDMPSDEMTDSELEANARLIAAAPDLLAALQAAVDLYTPTQMSGSEWVYPNWYKQGRAAIAKATGA